MKRRTFLKSTIGTGSIIASGGLLANDIISHVIKRPDSSTKDLKSVLSDYFDMIFNGKQFDINMLPTEGKIKLTESYKLIINDNKNNIFDIAKLVIDKTSQYGFDSKELLNGKIPEGLTIYKGAISFTSNETLVGIKLPELKNYDAQIEYQNPIIIKYKIPFSKWKNENKFDLLLSNEKSDLYEGEKTKIKIFKLKIDTTNCLSIDNVDPLVINNNSSQDEFAINKNIISEYFSYELLNLLS